MLTTISVTAQAAEEEDSEEHGSKIYKFEGRFCFYIYIYTPR